MFHRLVVHIDQITAKATEKNNKATEKKIEKTPQSKDSKKKNEKKESFRSSHTPVQGDFKNPTLSSRSRHISKETERPAKKR